jgi:hypothetical protein
VTDFALSIRPASPVQRDVVEQLEGAPLGSDACVLVYVGPKLVGWGDDYGTFHGLEQSGVSRERGEALLQAATEVWEDRVAAA